MGPLRGRVLHDGPVGIVVYVHDPLGDRAHGPGRSPFPFTNEAQVRTIRRWGSVDDRLLYILAAAAALGGAVGRSVYSYGKLGAGPPDACLPAAGSTAGRPACPGYPPSDIADTPEFRRWLSGLSSWRPESVELPRKTSGPTPVMTRVTALDATDKAPIKLLASRGLVVAKLERDPAGGEDPRYGIGRPGTEALGRTYYFVVRPFDPSKLSYAWRWASGRTSYPIAHWTIYGVRNGVQLDSLKSGAFHWCRHTHEATSATKPATFTTCKNAEEASKIEHRLLQKAASDPKYAQLVAAIRQYSLLGVILNVQPGPVPRSTVGVFAQQEPLIGELLSADDMKTIQRIRDEALEAPVWVRCGVGCCTADEL